MKPRSEKIITKALFRKMILERGIVFKPFTPKQLIQCKLRNLKQYGKRKVHTYNVREEFCVKTGKTYFIYIDGNEVHRSLALRNKYKKYFASGTAHSQKIHGQNISYREAKEIKDKLIASIGIDNLINKYERYS